MVAAVAALTLVAAACGSSSSDDGAAAPTTAPAPTTVAPTTSAPATGPTEAPPAPAASTVDFAPWQTIEITDVDGVTFTLASLAGRPLFVENFATWCPTCRSQLGRTQAAAATLGDEAVVLALSVETDLSSDEVADYAKDNGFDNIRFAVMSDEMLAAFVDAFGTSAANPPSTPHVVVAADGTPGEMKTGGISEDAIVAAVRGA
ncbi:MAG: TlpA family protein disulfide reductase [Acidimicrobiales bacterium]|nr:TlpA family protein disulfide reductase [Acidimicrobiales bacterium]